MSNAKAMPPQLDACGIPKSPLGHLIWYNLLVMACDNLESTQKPFCCVDATNFEAVIFTFVGDVTTTLWIYFGIPGLRLLLVVKL